MKKPVIITTEHRGIFCGYLNEKADRTADAQELFRVRMYIRYRHGKGLTGCASTLPSDNCLIGNEAPSATIKSVTAVIDITPEVEKALWPST